MLSLKGYRKRVLRRVSLSILHLPSIFLEKKEEKKYIGQICVSFEAILLFLYIL